jgi:hypothetical protein
MPYVIERNGSYYSGQERGKSVWVKERADALEYNTVAIGKAGAANTARVLRAAWRDANVAA